MYILVRNGYCHEQKKIVCMRRRHQLPEARNEVAQVLTMG